ncbi:MAG: isoprenoid biosynthesis glyoxalase ElbB [Phycisphaerae bacterium]|jgi:enhancing lycopene biosynthesis protein 2|nr:isoprenoid biosynthesis glyoxalase ElbB [Phycisphaerae bacterium]MCZ2399066.1 isoprenoid biosynthesis glyoxalase ElbB [Phycisphaerae bacterium]
MAKRVGVLLSGCGVKDGAEIQEAALTLLALDQRGAQAVCCAPDCDFEVIDHVTGKPAGERRNVLRESARISRGEIRDVAHVTPADLDALVMPGGFGAAKNLCGFATQGADCAVNPAVEKLVAGMLAARKPIGAICIAPALLARIAGKHGVAARLTIGNDAGTARTIEAMGARHEACPVREFVVDREHKIVSTPAYMLGRGPAEVFEGIRKLVDEVLSLA